MRKTKTVRQPTACRKSSERKHGRGTRLFFVGALVAVLGWILWQESFRTTIALKKSACQRLTSPVAALPKPSGPKPLFLAACLFAVLQFHGFPGMSPTPDFRSAVLPYLQGPSRMGITLDAAQLSITLSTFRSLASQASRVAAPLPPPPPAPPTSEPEPVAALGVAAAQAPAAAFMPASAASSVISGIATWYGGVDGFDSADGMADGTPFNPDDPTIAASNHWPLGTRLLVCHGANCVTVSIRDRGGFRHALDLSRAAFSRLAPLSGGVISVTIQVLP